MAALATGALLVLAAGIDSFDFTGGYLTGNSEREQIQATGIPADKSPGFFSKLLIFLIPIGLAALIISLIFKETRKRVIIVSLLGFLFLFLFSLLYEPPEPEGVEREGVPPMTFTGDESMFGAGEKVPVPPKEELADSPSSLMVFLVTLLAMGGAAAGGFFVWRKLTRKGSEPSDELEAEVTRSLNKIRNREDVGNVVIRCYLEMNRIIGEEVGLTRKEAMTPREFEEHLRGRGVEREDIHTLTGLFEQVRYGGRQADDRLCREAERCLSSIAQSLTNSTGTTE